MPVRKLPYSSHGVRDEWRGPPGSHGTGILEARKSPDMEEAADRLCPKFSLHFFQAVTVISILAGPTSSLTPTVVRAG